MVRFLMKSKQTKVPDMPKIQLLIKKLWA